MFAQETPLRKDGLWHGPRGRGAGLGGWTSLWHWLRKRVMALGGQASWTRRGPRGHRDRSPTAVLLQPHHCPAVPLTHASLVSLPRDGLWKEQQDERCRFSDAALGAELDEEGRPPTLDGGIKLEAFSRGASVPRRGGADAAGCMRLSGGRTTPCTLLSQRDVASEGCTGSTRRQPTFLLFAFGASGVRAHTKRKPCTPSASLPPSRLASRPVPSPPDVRRRASPPSSVPSTFLTMGPSDDARPVITHDRTPDLRPPCHSIAPLLGRIASSTAPRSSRASPAGASQHTPPSSAPIPIQSNPIQSNPIQFCLFLKSPMESLDAVHTQTGADARKTLSADACAPVSPPSSGMNVVR